MEFGEKFKIPRSSPQNHPERTPQAFSNKNFATNSRMSSNFRRQQTAGNPPSFKKANLDMTMSLSPRSDENVHEPKIASLKCNVSQGRWMNTPLFPLT
jgi:hypothetical protein